jgi:HAD superfamily hydrolase (TIGR01509 family)
MSRLAARVVMAARATDMGVKAIIFDCFGVLYVGSLQALYDITPKEHWRELADLNAGSDYGYVTADEYATRLSELTGKSKDEIIDLRRREHARNDALVACLYELKKNYKVGLLSNVGFDLIERLFTEQERSELFDAMVLSSTEGIVKPHPRIYQIAAERLGVSAGDCLMIDDLQKNVDGADAAGMRGLQYTNLANLKSDLARLGVQ